MTVTVYPAPPETERWVSSYRFLFQLHTIEQQFIMSAVRAAALSLTPAQFLNMDPEATDANGYPLTVLKVFSIAYDQMERLGGRLDLLSADLNTYFQAASAIGLYGETSEEIAAEIARIKSDTRPGA
jgi:hypothetical protein